MIYIGRARRGEPINYWGNNYKIKGMTREQSIYNYIAECCTNAEFMQRVRNELKGQSLICFCKPLDCHGDWLFMIANVNIKRFQYIMSHLNEITVETHLSYIKEYKYGLDVAPPKLF